MACLLVKSTVMNHTSTAQVTATSYPDDDDVYRVPGERNWRDQSKNARQNNEVAAYYLADNDRSLVTLQKYPEVNATFVHCSITLLTSESVKILQVYDLNHFLGI